MVSTVSAEGKKGAKNERERKKERETKVGGRVGRGKFQRISNSQLFSIATAFDASFVRQRGRRMRIEG